MSTGAAVRAACGRLRDAAADWAEWTETRHQRVRLWSPASLWAWAVCHRRLSVCGAVLLAVVVVGMARAGADPGTGASAGDGDVLISWMGIKDSHNVPVAKYTMTLNQGGWSDPSAKGFYYVDAFVYECYLVVTTTALWLIKFVLSFEWLKIFTVPFQTIGNGINAAVERYGLAPTALAVLAVIVVCTFLTGKVAKAFSQIAMGMLMIGLAASIFANPLSELVGPDGLLAKGRDTGLEIAVSVSDGSMSTNGSKANVDGLVEKLADRFLRSPTQMINFGMVSDSISRKCEEAWSSGIMKGHGDTLKDDIKGCDAQKGKVMHKKSMDNPAAILVPLSMCSLLSFFLVAFACYFVWHVVRTAVQAMLFAMLAPPAFAIAVIPGGPQTFAFKTVLDCAMAYVAMIVFTAAFGGYNVVLDRVFASTNNAIQAIFMTSLVLAFGFAFFGPLHRMFERSRDSLAAKFSGGTQGASSGQNWLSKAADVSRVKQELQSHLGGNSNRSPARQPGRVDTGSPVSIENERATDTADSGAVTVSSNENKAAGVRVDNAPSSAGGSASSSPAAAAPSRSSAQVSLVEWSGSSVSSSRPNPLAVAERLAAVRTGGKGGSTLYVPHGTRHALSEAA
ncbi:Uncharacterised protein [Mycobacteroides abscessus subsp. abscessus]|uniref:hypothetical protein n=1 Tax=Mycobacteroides abscessus TaxID=36809 RepID=UPI0009280692|nr:hypothetical protein [Mycobacteroides abscessus]SIJ21662.1 Uncharacterised protein [Mycobacteroides abscessus subsp. abscessus]SLH38888.1 Uncharacterised protein [Mycobacteroides abscessus subsp. abscessus]